MPLVALHLRQATVRPSAPPMANMASGFHQAVCRLDRDHVGARAGTAFCFNAYLFRHTSSSVSRMTADVGGIGSAAQRVWSEATPLRLATPARDGHADRLDLARRRRRAPNGGRAQRHEESVLYMLRETDAFQQGSEFIQARALQGQPDLAQTQLSLSPNPPIRSQIPSSSCLGDLADVHLRCLPACRHRRTRRSSRCCACAHCLPR